MIVDDADERGPFRGAAYAARRPLGVDLDVFVYRPDEVESWSPRLRDEVAGGVSLYRRAATA